MQPFLEEAPRSPGDDTQWTRPELHAWTALLLLGTCLLYCVRVTLPVCAVAVSQDFGWSKKEAGLVLSSFFWGYCLTQHRGREGHPAVGLHLGLHHGGHPAGRPPRRCPPGLRELVRPHGAAPRRLPPRADQPAAPEGARAREGPAYSTGGVGSQPGTLVTGAVGSLLLDWCGWQSVFYFSGGLTLVWVCYLYRYLLRGKDPVLAPSVLAQGLPVPRPSRVPWRQLFRKPRVWAAIFSQLSAACSFFILLSWLPTFFKETFPHSKGWVFNVVPWLVAIPSSLFSGFLSDHLIAQGYQVITVRTFMQTMGLGLSSMFALCLGHTKSFLKAVVFASASVGLQTFNHSGISVHIQDLAPSCAGFLFGVANTAGALAVSRCHFYGCRLQELPCSGWPSLSSQRL